MEPRLSQKKKKTILKRHKESNKPLAITIHTHKINTGNKSWHNIRTDLFISPTLDQQMKQSKLNIMHPIIVLNHPLLEKKYAKDHNFERLAQYINPN